MSVKNKTNKNYKRSQKGRSMVEMLGVLAIVGVLSVGGVYGYGVAMKKHKANELLHQASMLATTISSQILTDKPLNVQDFGNGKYEHLAHRKKSMTNNLKWKSPVWIRPYVSKWKRCQAAWFAKPNVMKQH